MKTCARMSCVTVLYDEDCGFCRWTLAWLLRWDRRGRLAVAPIQSPEGQRALADLPEDVRMASWHALDTDGRRESGGGAFPMAFAELRGGAPLAGAPARWPRAAERAYRFVAQRRSLWGRALSMRTKARADAVVERRRREPAAPRGPQGKSVASASPAVIVKTRTYSTGENSFAPG